MNPMIAVASTLITSSMNISLDWMLTLVRARQNGDLPCSRSAIGCPACLPGAGGADIETFPASK